MTAATVTIRLLMIALLVVIGSSNPHSVPGQELIIARTRGKSSLRV
jgi:hypothetical protein